MSVLLCILEVTSRSDVTLWLPFVRRNVLLLFCSSVAVFLLSFSAVVSYCGNLLLLQLLAGGSEK